MSSSESGWADKDLAGGPRRLAEENAAPRRSAARPRRDLSLRLIQAREDERGRIARELHDEIGQALTALMLNIKGALRDPGSTTTAARLEESLVLVEQTIRQVRDLSLDLRPSVLDDLGLLDALRSYVLGFANRTGIKADFSMDPRIGRLDPDMETAIYRLAREALTNVARHSGASRVLVELALDDDALRLVVADDGRGFDVDSATARALRGESLGLPGMRERAALLEGDVEIISKPGRGTEVRASIPLAGASGSNP